MRSECSQVPALRRRSALSLSFSFHFYSPPSDAQERPQPLCHAAACLVPELDLSSHDCTEHPRCPCTHACCARLLQWEATSLRLHHSTSPNSRQHLTQHPIHTVLAPSIPSMFCIHVFIPDLFPHCAGPPRAAPAPRSCCARRTSAASSTSSATSPAPRGHLQHARGGGGHHVRGPPARRQPQLHGHVHQEPVLHRYETVWNGSCLGLQVSGAVSKLWHGAVPRARGSRPGTETCAACTVRWLQQLEPVRLARHMAVLHRPLADLHAMRWAAEAWMMGLCQDRGCLPSPQPPKPACPQSF